MQGRYQPTAPPSTPQYRRAAKPVARFRANTNYSDGVGGAGLRAWMRESPEMRESVLCTQKYALPRNATKRVTWLLICWKSVDISTSTKPATPLNDAHHGGLLCFWLRFAHKRAMRHFNKPSKSIPDQIVLLQERGMVIENAQQATWALSHISYYRLRAYWLYYEADPESGNHAFKNGTTLEAVLALYEFDRRLRLLLMDALERIEVAARGAWAHQMAMVYGPHGYLNAALYPRVDRFQANLAQLQSEYDRSHDVFVDHYKRTYDNPSLPPVWMAAEFISFGLLSKFFSALGGRADRKAIARRIGFDDRVFQGLMHHLATVRNICAHHSRLWNRRFTVTFPIAQTPANLAETIDPEADRKLYNTLSMLLHSMRVVAPESDWPHRLACLIAENPTGDFAAMGFPDDWRERPLWAHLCSD